MHVMDDVHRVDIQAAEPLKIDIKALPSLKMHLLLNGMF